MIQGRRVRFVVLLLLALCVPAAAQPVGPEFLVNTHTTFSQLRAGVAADDAGRFVVVWTSYDQDGDDYGIFGQRYDSDGNPAGAEFLVNTYTTSSQFVPDVAADSAGNFIVVWESQLQDIFGQRYDSAGMPQGAEFPVNTYTTSSQRFPAVAAASAGDFVVVWESFGQDGSGTGIFGQRYDSAGMPQGAEFPVNAYTTSNQSQAAVAANGAGGFTVVWRDAGGQDGDGDGVFGQRYDASGAPDGTEFQVNTYTTGSQARPVVAADGAGNLTVAWRDASGQDGDGDGVFGQRYDAGGAQQGPEFVVNTYTTADQGYPAAATDPAGGVVVTWEGGGAQDGSGIGIFGQRYDGACAPQGAEFQVNTYTTGGQTFPAVAAGAAGTFVVVWQAVQDGSVFGILAQRFAAPALIPVKVAIIKPGKRFRFVARGTFALPDPMSDDPTTEGGSLSFAGATGGKTYALPAACWKGIGPGGDGSKGFKCNDVTTCKSVVVKKRVIKALCTPDTGDSGPLPEAGPVGIVLTVGTGTTRYCGSCGGTLKGNATKIFKRRDCAAPPACP